MAWLELAPSGIFHVAFRYCGRKLKRSLDTDNPRVAERARQRVEENQRLVEQGRLVVPEGADIAEFLLYDSKLKAAFRTPDGSVKSAYSPRAMDKINTPAMAIVAEPPSPSRLQTATDSGTERVIAPVSIGQAFDEYLANLPENALGPETIRVAKIHFGHLKQVLGARTPMRKLDTPQRTNEAGVGTSLTLT